MKNFKNLFWDLNYERLTLGGAMVLRMEGELLANINGLLKIKLYINKDNLDLNYPKKIIDSIFKTSKIDFIIKKGKPDSNYWPSEIEMSKNRFSYYSFSRIIELYKNKNIKVNFLWNETLINKSKNFINKFEKKLITIHLKRVSPFNVNESNANFGEWYKFLISYNNENNFLIIGDDEIDNKILNIKNVYSASKMSLSLSQQLCIISFSKAFIGMASGICNAANFSKVPHVIFKHPDHHKSEMKIEMGNSNKFNFSTNKQFLWRKEANFDNISKAYNLICSK
tara:strand:+ start:1371 stop:2216 length:846 start_codon:yes stop_codon:yes gene_type:complete